jgi:hypothetical protein
MFHRLLRSEVAESVAAANHFEHVVGICEDTRVSRCTQIPEQRLVVINLFPGFDCRFTALKSRNVALKSVLTHFR